MTKDLRQLVKELLDQADGATFYRTASVTAAYPYKVFSFGKTRYSDSRDVEICIDLYDRGGGDRLGEIADEIERIFDDLNAPQDGILPTFFLDDRYPVEEKDKELEHIQMRIQTNLYNKE